MKWERILGNWKQLTGIVRQRWSRKRQHQADAKQLAEWLAREHKADPIHK